MNRSVKKTKTDTLFAILSRFYVLFFALLCFLPFLLVISGSITKESSIVHDGFRLIPKEVSFAAYRLAFELPTTTLKAYGISFLITAIGTAASLFLLSMTAYVLQRKDFKLRNVFAFYFYFTTVFGAGLVPWYILIVKYLHLKDNLLVLILPGLFNVIYMIIIRSFMNSIPYSLTESAKIDGAGDFRIYAQLILPLSKPALASMGLFVSLNYWNDFLNALLFIENKNYYPLQFYLYNLLRKQQVLQEMAGMSTAAIQTHVTDMPNDSLKMAMAIVTVIPVLLVYPFVQKYFVKGVMIGAVKG
ncbi:carbohydrate ABC transporter permease [Cohnella endophytica]|uniref:Carbohydrate ABC transporter permease n=1 Tax=Cohnella endophytica TaxID=2419778 RepID=A0A494XUY6_9BACL|nr:carbohydrate ABC transporter permease [Cohnella endophytica]RKP54443.1 carbohydrate ABC transporter permease [Cohnella endophytica]